MPTTEDPKQPRIDFSSVDAVLSTLQEAGQMVLNEFITKEQAEGIGYLAQVALPALHQKANPFMFNLNTPAPIGGLFTGGGGKVNP